MGYKVWSMSSAAGGGLRILLVEDDPDHAELVRRTLSGHGVPLDLTVVEDGERALRLLLGPGEGPLPHLILLDLRLPRRDGLDVLREVKATPRLREVPCVVLTTSEAEGDKVRARELQADGYLVKPGDHAQFQRLIREVDSRRQRASAPE
jgi:CheY-like chemotaxis protein